MDIKTTELIAIGASVTANCIPCLKYHCQKAEEVGVSQDEIKEAVRIGRMVRKGSSGEWDKEAAAILES